ncbi:Protein FAM228B [Trichoplax sp. H2]|nr:Protein FAM228B [Trichoplax sp. H2]|eukprot:RDD41884.1 Protein FAM228B [Trichoplax sp. H2]
MKKTFEKSNKDNLTIISDQFTKDILNNSDDEIRSSFYRKLAQRNRTSSAPAKPATSASFNTLNKLRKQGWISKDSLKERLDHESLEARRLYSRLKNVEDTFVKGVNQYVEYEDEKHDRKKRMLNKKWNEHVYDVVQIRVNDVMKDYNKINKEKRHLIDQYIQYTNRKYKVLLDDYSPEEYDPVHLQRNRYHGSRRSAAPIRDPLILQERARTAEDRTVRRCDTGVSCSSRELAKYRLPSSPLVPLGRGQDDSRDWIKMELYDITSNIRTQSRKRMNTEKNTSQVNKLIDKGWDPPQVDYHRRREYFQPHDGTPLISPMPKRQPIKLSWTS